MHPTRLLIITTAWMNAAQGLPRPQAPSEDEAPQAPRPVDQTSGGGGGGGGGGFWPTVFSLGATAVAGVTGWRNGKALKKTQEDLDMMKNDQARLHDDLATAHGQIEAIQAEQQQTPPEPSNPTTPNSPSKNPRRKKTPPKQKQQPSGQKPPNQRAHPSNQKQQSRAERVAATLRALEADEEAERCIVNLLQIPVVVCLYTCLCGSSLHLPMFLSARPPAPQRPFIAENAIRISRGNSIGRDEAKDSRHSFCDQQTDSDQSYQITAEVFNVAARACDFQGPLMPEGSAFAIDQNQQVDETSERRNDESGPQPLSISAVPGLILESAKRSFLPPSGSKRPMGAPARIPGPRRFLPMRIR